MSLQHYRDLTREAEADPEYWKEIAVNDFARELTLLMQKRGIKNADLARRMGVQRQYVTKLLAGTNATLGSMVKLAMALDAVVRISLETKEDREKDLQEERRSANALEKASVVLEMTQHPRPALEPTAPKETKSRRARHK